MLCGQQHSHLNKLESFDMVQAIINDLQYTSYTGIELGLKYGVSDQAISDINTGRT